MIFEICSLSAILTGFGLTVVDVDLAVLASVAVLTEALETVHQIHTHGGVVTRAVTTVVNVDFTERTAVSIRAQAQETVVLSR